MTESQQLAEQFATVAHQLAAAGDFRETLRRIVDLAVEMVRDCEHAGASLVTRGKIETPAQSDKIPVLIDQAQQEAGEGPCLDAIRERAVVEIRDLTSENRWPDFVRLATARTDVRSVLAVRLFLESETLGALNLYSSQLDAFDHADRGLVSIFAVHAAVALRAARSEDQLTRAVEGRDLIGQAKGILMAREHVDADTAFTMLARASQDANVKLAEIAKTVIERRASH